MRRSGIDLLNDPGSWQKSPREREHRRKRESPVCPPYLVHFSARELGMMSDCEIVRSCEQRARNSLIVREIFIPLIPAKQDGERFCNRRLDVSLIRHRRIAARIREIEGSRLNRARVYLSRIFRSLFQSLGRYYASQSLTFRYISPRMVEFK